MAVVEGMVAGVGVTSAEIADQLARRRLGYGRGARMKFERDAVTMLSGVRHGVTLGGPIAIDTTRAIVAPEQAGSILCVWWPEHDPGTNMVVNADLRRAGDGRRSTRSITVDRNRPDGTLGIRSTGEFSLEESLAELRG